MCKCLSHTLINVQVHDQTEITCSNLVVRHIVVLPYAIIPVLELTQNLNYRILTVFQIKIPDENYFFLNLLGDYFCNNELI